MRAYRPGKRRVCRRNRNASRWSCHRAWKRSRCVVAILQRECEILSHEQLSETTWRIELSAKDIARLVKPGQFVHLRIPEFGEHILRRPFSVFQADSDAQVIRIVYRVVGEGTRRMTELACGDTVDIIGPIGNGWRLPNEARRVLIIGAGVGAAPVYELAKRGLNSGMDVTVVLGAQTHAELVFEKPYLELGVNVTCATDDGSYGFAGFCTDAALEAVDAAKAAGEPFDYCAVCGPYPVMRIAAGFCREKGIPCEVSMERRMACGIGACLSCVLDTTDGKKRSCVDGPVFDANEVKW
ncbi:MAG: dihydroorotate dehydrogenase electron transfer subunit [Eggerthellaceae bacterium]|nr:dihydroorotate dehydrogenase electron transfer subunit [Eggerthellaceae bacterium]